MIEQVLVLDAIVRRPWGRMSRWRLSRRPVLGCFEIVKLSNVFSVVLSTRSGPLMRWLQEPGCG